MDSIFPAIVAEITAYLPTIDYKFIAVLERAEKVRSIAHSYYAAYYINARNKHGQMCLLFVIVSLQGNRPAVLDAYNLA